MIRKVVCQFGTIITLGWAAVTLLSTNLIDYINTQLLTNDIFKIVWAGILIALGFLLAQKCKKEKDSCKL